MGRLHYVTVDFCVESAPHINIHFCVSVSVCLTCDLVESPVGVSRVYLIAGIVP